MVHKGTPKKQDPGLKTLSRADEFRVFSFCSDDGASANHGIAKLTVARQRALNRSGHGPSKSTRIGLSDGVKY